MKKSSKTSEPAHLEWGSAGDNPQEVTKNYGWVCADTAIYRVEKR